MGETSAERPTFSSVPPSTRVANASPGGASQPACSLSALEGCQPLLLLDTLQEAAPNIGSGGFLEERRGSMSLESQEGKCETHLELVAGKGVV